MIQNYFTIFAVKRYGPGYYYIEEKVLRKTYQMTKTGTDSRELQQKIDEYGDMLFKLSLVRLRNVQDAEDVVQEVFYQYVRNTSPFQDAEHEKAWLLKVTLNACRKVWRSAWRRHHSEWNPDDGRMEAPEPNGVDREMQSMVPGPEEAAFRKEERRCLMSAVMALPVKYRDVIHLFYYEELSVKEIARITGRVESTVTSQLTRGRELLKKSLKEEYDFG